MKTLKTKIKKVVFRGGMVVTALYLLSGVNLSLSQDTFCAKVNRFVVGPKGDEIVSLVRDGQSSAQGYRVKNLIRIPFQFSLGSRRRMERLVVGQRYKFTTAGRNIRALGHLPVIVKDEPASQCAAETGAYQPLYERKVQ